jgi:hypothetical protein
LNQIFENPGLAQQQVLLRQLLLAAGGAQADAD